MRTNRIAITLVLSLLAPRVVQAQSGTPGSDVEVVLAGSGLAWGIFTYNDGSGRIDFVTNRISVDLQLYPSSPQMNGYLFSSRTGLFNGTININTTAIETEPGLSTTDNLSNQPSYHEPGFAIDTSFFGPQFLGLNPGDLANLTLEPPTAGTQTPEPYRMFYDGTNKNLTIWIRLPNPFTYAPFPSDDEAYTIPCTAKVTGNGSSFSGTVKDSLTGKPIPNATVLIDGRSFMTDANGMFFVAYIAPGPLTIQISAPGYVSYEKTEPLSPFSAVEVTFALTSLSGITGHVYCSCDSNVIAGASVQIGNYSTTSDSDGRYSISSLSAGTYTVTVSRLNYAPLTTTIAVPASMPTVTADLYLTNLTLVINPMFDPTLTEDADASTITNSVKAAILAYELEFADPICVGIRFTKTSDDTLAESDTSLQTVTYAEYLSALSAHSRSDNDAVALAHLPPGPNNPVNDNLLMDVKTANLRALELDEGLATGNPDSTVSFNMLNITQEGYDLTSIASHEIDEALGLGSALDYQDGLDAQGRAIHTKNGDPVPTGPVFPQDLFRYDQNGARSFVTSIDAVSYFSLDGVTKLAQFNQYDGSSDTTPASADFGDWYSPPNHLPVRVQDAFGTQYTKPALGVELTALDVIGYDFVGALPPLSLASVGRTGDLISFTWDASSGRSYQIQYKNDLTSPLWRNIGPPLTASGSTLSASVSMGLNQQLFYRVTVLPAPRPAVGGARQQSLGPLHAVPMRLPPPTRKIWRSYFRTRVQ